MSGQITMRLARSPRISRIHSDWIWSWMYPKKSTMIWYFWEGFFSLVRVKIKQRNRELDSFKELIKKIVDVEAKAVFWLRSYTCETDQNCLQRSQPSTVKANTQGQPMKNRKIGKPKSRPQKLQAPAPQRSDSAKTSEQAWKEKKKKDKRHLGQKPLEGFTPTIRSSLTNRSTRKPWTKKDISQIISYNYSKKGHYANKYLKPPKSKN